MSYIVDHVTTDLLVSFGRWDTFAHIFERIKVHELTDLALFGISPTGVVIHFVDSHGIGVIVGNLVAIFVPSGGTIRLELGLVGESTKKFGTLANTSNLAPSRLIEQTFLKSILGDLSSVSLDHSLEWFPCTLPIFPLNEEVPL